MDPNTALDNMRTAQRAYDKAEKEGNTEGMASAASDLMDATLALDGWLSSGGFLPRPWRPTVYVATASAGRCAFTALGDSVDAAKAALLGGWKRHCRQYGMDDIDYLSADDINTMSGQIGAAFRDDSAI